MRLSSIFNVQQPLLEGVTTRGGVPQGNGLKLIHCIEKLFQTGLFLTSKLDIPIIHTG